MNPRREGGTPSFGFPAIYLIDPKVMEMEVVCMGDGSGTSLVKIHPVEIAKANWGEVVRIRKSGNEEKIKTQGEMIFARSGWRFKGERE